MNYRKYKGLLNQAINSGLTNIAEFHAFLRNRV